MQLVPLTDYVPDLIPDLRYTTKRNITGQVLTDECVARLTPQAAKALGAAADLLRKKGLRIVVWDAHRHLSVQKKLLAIEPDERYVSKHSKHLLGTAIDLSLANEHGKLLDMGTDHDDFSVKAHAGAKGLTYIQQQNRKLLSDAMQQAGFTQWPYEWWHFEYKL